MSEANDTATPTTPAAPATAGAPADGPVIHRRTIVVEAVEEGDGLRVQCRLTDERPFMIDEPSGVAHDLTLTVHVRADDRVITEADVDFTKFPHAECPEIAPAFQQLVGLSTARGYTRQVKQRLAGTSGCNHLEHLATVLAPAMVQAMSGLRHWHRMQHPDEQPGPFDPTWLFDTCHVWREDGPAREKVELGWPDNVERTYPSLSAVEIRRRRGLPANG